MREDFSPTSGLLCRNNHWFCREWQAFLCYFIPILTIPTMLIMLMVLILTNSTFVFAVYKRYDTLLSPLTVWLLWGRVWGGESVGWGWRGIFFFYCCWFLLASQSIFFLFFVFWSLIEMISVVRCGNANLRFCLFVWFFYFILKCQSWFVVKLLYCYVLVLSYAFIWFLVDITSCLFWYFITIVIPVHSYSIDGASRAHVNQFLLLSAICSWWHYDGIMNTQILYWRTEFQFECFALPGTCCTTFFLLLQIMELALSFYCEYYLFRLKRSIENILLYVYIAATWEVPYRRHCLP